MGPGSVTATLSAAAIRDFLSQSAELHAWTANDMAKRLGLGRQEAEQVVAALAAVGYIEPVRGRRVWRNTPAGNAVAGVTKAKPVARKTAEKNLAALLDRVPQVKKDGRFLYRVDEAVVFGPFVTSADPVKAVHVALRLTPKEPDPARQQQLVVERAAEAERAGKRFKSFAERMRWGETEVRNFLKGRARSIALHELKDWMLREPHRTVYRGAER